MFEDLNVELLPARTLMTCFGPGPGGAGGAGGSGGDASGGAGGNGGNGGSASITIDTGGGDVILTDSTIEAVGGADGDGGSGGDASGGDGGAGGAGGDAPAATAASDATGD